MTSVAVAAHFRRLDLDHSVMALMSPATTVADIDRRTEFFREAIGALSA
jgi:hypothetical protein